VDHDGEREREVESESQGRVDFDAVESEAGELDGGVVGVEEIDGEGEEEERGGADEEFAEEKSASCWSGVVYRGGRERWRR